ncbi:MAG: PilZ domain-containing protein [Magnetococcales bacterium]|nr:PilZ domain-containing protein [Magnetococcales bacterium]
MAGGDEGIYYEEEKIRTLFQQAGQANVLSDFFLDQEDGVYCAPLRPESGSADRGVVIAPLEPAPGNVKIRRCRQVTMRFFLGMSVYEAKTAFSKAVAVENGQVIELTLPKVMRAQPRRVQHRRMIPPSLTIPVRVQKRGAASLEGQLVDISPGGMSFTCTMVKEPVEPGDRVAVEVFPRGVVGGTFSSLVTVCYVSQARDAGDLQTVMGRFGVQFGSMSITQSMQMDRLIKWLKEKG